MQVLNKKVVIITGASSGIGEASAKLFARQGALLVLGARRKQLLDTIVDDIEAEGGRAIAVEGDVKNETYAKRLVATALETFGRLDVGFNNAGIIGDMSSFAETTSGSWATVLETNLTGSFFCAKHQLAHLSQQGSGSVIFTSSFVGHTIGFAGMAPYAASKAGLIGMTQCLAVEYGDCGVRVNALLPGGTKTDMAGDFSSNPDAEAAIGAFHALKRMANPDEVAQAALFLASEQSSFVTGSAMLVDGGNSISKGVG